jgi:hypothetical protein
MSSCFESLARATTGSGHFAPRPRSGGFPTAERARQEDWFNTVEMNNGRLGNRPSVSRENRRKNARCVEISALFPGFLASELLSQF